MHQPNSHASRHFELPRNFEDIAVEVSQGIADVYGEEGARLYREQAIGIFSAYLHSPNLRFWGWSEHDTCLTVVLTNLTLGRGEISLAHRMNEGGLDSQADEVLRTAIEELRSRGAASILSEFLPTSTWDGVGVLRESGFARVRRHVLSRALSDFPLHWPAGETLVLLDDALVQAAAACLISAYAEDPGRVLHEEMQSIHAAERFVSRVLSGQLGATAPGMNLVYMDGDQCLGVALGCLLSPHVGFTMQLGVVPEARGRGLSRLLLEAQLTAFAAAGCTRTSLAVTQANLPACNLYRSCGYQLQREFDSHVWYRDWEPGAHELLSGMDGSSG